MSNLYKSDGKDNSYSVSSTVVIAENELPSVTWKANSNCNEKSASKKLPGIKQSQKKPVNYYWERKKRLEKLAWKLAAVLFYVFIILLILGFIAIFVYFMWKDALKLYTERFQGNIEPFSNATNITGKNELHPNLGWTLDVFQNLVHNTSAV